MVKTIGHFKYHRFEVIFTCDEDAGVANVTMKEHGLVRDSTDHTFESFDSNFIASARSHFENCVGRALCYTSKSDVELFVQQGK